MRRNYDAKYGSSARWNAERASGQSSSQKLPHYPGLVQTSDNSADGAPFVLVLPIFGIILSARGEVSYQRMHPFRWFAMVLACFIRTVSPYPPLFRSAHPLAAMIHTLVTIALLAFEYLCFCVAKLMKRRSKNAPN